MHPQTIFCPNLACPARGQQGKGNITIHSQKEQRYRCTQCGKTFSSRKGTPLYRRQTPEDRVAQVLTLITYGCPVVAIQAAFRIQAQTVRDWVEAAGTHAEAVHHDLVVRERDLGHVQADELRLKTQCGIVWMAMAMMVSTRLWLGGVVSTRRDHQLIEQLVDVVRRCAAFGPLLVMVDGFASYVSAFTHAFRWSVPLGHMGRPRKLPWPDFVLGQVIKERVNKRIVGITVRVAQGWGVELLHRLWQTPGCVVPNTAYIERLNGTFRARLAVLGRRTHHLAHRKEMLHASMYLLGAVYNFCSFHRSLRTAAGQPQTPAMAAGITKRCWTIGDLLHYHVAPPRWTPPKRRGRRSKELQALVERWAT